MPASYNANLGNGAMSPAMSRQPMGGPGALGDPMRSMHGKVDNFEAEFMMPPDIASIDSDISK